MDELEPIQRTADQDLAPDQDTSEERKASDDAVFDDLCRLFWL
jgi:hypothetical protein